jgi:hypothetical protein
LAEADRIVNNGSDREQRIGTSACRHVAGRPPPILFGTVVAGHNKPPSGGFLRRLSFSRFVLPFCLAAGVQQPRRNHLSQIPPLDIVVAVSMRTLSSGVVLDTINGISRSGNKRRRDVFRSTVTVSVVLAPLALTGVFRK